MLATSGRLLFFAVLDYRADAYGEVARVLWLGDGAPPQRTPAPKGAASPTKGVGLLTPQALLALPYYEDPVFEALELSDDEGSVYHDEVFLNAFPDPAHLLLGYASYGTPHSVDGQPFLAQLAADRRIDFSEGDAQTLRFYFGSERRGVDDFDGVVSTLEQY